MKTWILIFISSLAFADTFRLEYNLNYMPFSFSKKAYIESGELNMGYQITCRESERALCHSLCGQDSCVVSKDSCDSCISSSNLNVFAIFRDFAKLFTLSRVSIDWSPVFTNLFSGHWRMMDENAILNLFDDTQSEERYADAKAKFLSSCPAGTMNAFLLVESKTLMPQIYVCQGSYGQIVYRPTLNPEFSR